VRCLPFVGALPAAGPSSIGSRLDVATRPRGLGLRRGCPYHSTYLTAQPSSNRKFSVRLRWLRSGSEYVIVRPRFPVARCSMNFVYHLCTPPYECDCGTSFRPGIATSGRLVRSERQAQFLSMHNSASCRRSNFACVVQLPAARIRSSATRSSADRNMFARSNRAASPHRALARIQIRQLFRIACLLTHVSANGFVPRRAGPRGLPLSVLAPAAARRRCAPMGRPVGVHWNGFRWQARGAGGKTRTPWLNHPD
jgi:hypothetical protein